MDWDEMLVEYRALGGIAENVRLGSGPLGRGIFPIDPGRPARLRTPENLLVPTDAVELRDGRLTVKAGGGLGERERFFFERYHESFGWSAGLFEELWESQLAWHRVPEEISRYLVTMGVLMADTRFVAPAPDVCLSLFLRTRNIVYREKLYLFPVVELVNHSNGASPYDLSDGVGAGGTFAGEMLVRYNARDPFSNAVAYGFSEAATFAFSVAITVDAFGRNQLSVGVKIGDYDMHEGAAFPRLSVDGNVVQLSHLVLGHANATDLPRGVFRSAMGPYLSPARADEVFDSIAHFNRMKFVNFLRLARKHDGPVVRMLEDAALKQLEVLSCCIGARAFSARG